MCGSAAKSTLPGDREAASSQAATADAKADSDAPSGVHSPARMESDVGAASTTHRSHGSGVCKASTGTRTSMDRGGGF